MTSPTEAHYSDIDGVPLYYWRYEDGEPRPVSIYSTYALQARLTWWVRKLRMITAKAEDPRYGTIDRIVTAGAYVNRSGQHGEGNAFDLDQVRWSGGFRSTPYWQAHSNTHRRVRRRYLAVDAMTRRAFRYVLDGWYNSAHADHIHMDLGGLPTVCSRSSGSDTVFVQAACNDFMDAGLVVDGVWGSLTEVAFAEARQRLRVTDDPFLSIRAWRQVLWRSARHGFIDRVFGYY